MFLETSQMLLSTSAPWGKYCLVEPHRSLIYLIRFTKAKAENISGLFIYLFICGGGQWLEMHRRQLCPGKTEHHGSSFCQSKLLTKSSPWRDTQEEYHLQKKTFFSPVEEAISVLKNRAFSGLFFLIKWAFVKLIHS